MRSYVMILFADHLQVSRSSENDTAESDGRRGGGGGRGRSRVADRVHSFGFVEEADRFGA